MIVFFRFFSDANANFSHQFVRPNQVRHGRGSIYMGGVGGGDEGAGVGGGGWGWRVGRATEAILIHQG